MLGRPHEAESACHIVHVDGLDTQFHVLAGFAGHIVFVQLSGKSIPLFMCTSSVQQHFTDLLTEFRDGKAQLRCKCVQTREQVALSVLISLNQHLLCITLEQDDILSDSKRTIYRLDPARCTL